VRSKTEEMASLIQRTAQKRQNNAKLKTKPSSLKETVRAIKLSGQQKRPGFIELYV